MVVLWLILFQKFGLDASSPNVYIGLKDSSIEGDVSGGVDDVVRVYDDALMKNNMVLNGFV